MNDEELRIAIERSRQRIVEKLGFDPRGCGDECPNHKFCHRHERIVKTLPCELSDEECGIDSARQSSNAARGNKLAWVA